MKKFDADPTLTKAAQAIAAHPVIAATPVGEIADAWCETVGDQQTIRDQISATAGFYEQVRIEEEASPLAILRGDYGEEAQRAFLGGALIALEAVVSARIELLESSSK